MSVYKAAGRRFYEYEFQIAGTRFRGGTGQVSRREAEQVERQKRDEAREALAAGRLTPDQMTVSDVFARYWTDHLHKLPSGPSYVHAISVILDAVGENKPYSQVGTNDVTRYVALRRERGKCILKHADPKAARRAKAQGVDLPKSYVRIGAISDSAIIGSLNIWRAAHNMARDVWEIPVKPIAWAKVRPDAPEKRDAQISERDLNALVAALPRHIMIVTAFTLATACRFGQMAGIERRHVDLAARTVQVRRQKRKVKNGAWVAETKPLNAAAVECVRQALSARGEARPGDLVFDVRNFRKEWVRARQEAGVPHFRFHDIRHAVATWMVREGVPLPVVRDALGHSSLAVTERYIDVDREDVARAMASLPSPAALQIAPVPDAEPDARRGVEIPDTARLIAGKSSKIKG